MSKQRTVRLECGKPTQVLYVLGTVIKFDIYKPSPPGCRSFEVTSSPGVNCSFSDKQNVSIAAHHATHWALTEDSLLLVTVDKVSSAANDGKVKVTFYGDDLDKPVDKMTLELTAVYVSLDVDADRDGIVEQNNPNKSSWMWGPKGHGAVLLVNCDKERSTLSGTDNMDDKVHSFEDLADMSRIIIRTEGPKSMPAGYTLNLHISPSDKEKVQLFRHDVAKMTCVLGRTKESTVMDFTKGSNEINFFAEGLAFPDNKNATLVTFNLSVVHQELPIFTDQVVFHFAPWIMTPNTQAPEEVFVCSVTDNKKFLIEFKKFVNKAHCKLTICPEDVNLDDVWMQDEIEFGYTDAPHKFMNIVLDSPRNRGLKNFAYKFLLGPDFGRIDLTSNTPDSLNAFGNLEVSPPVTVNGKEYPLGRIVIGSHLPIHPDGRKMAKVIKDLLMAQSVQSPIILYSDWLSVGHVDEFMSFVPAPDRKGFRLLLASPMSFYTLFKKLQKEGHGEVAMFENTDHNPVKINEILNNRELHELNSHVQHCIDWNRDILKVELGLDEADIIDLPTWFKPDEPKLVAAYFPDMVNMIVLGKYLGIPKPFGPLINGECALEAAVRSAFEPLDLNCTFIDDFTSYHKYSGEVHCGSNVRRKPFTFKWWNMEI